MEEEAKRQICLVEDKLGDNLGVTDILIAKDVRYLQCI